MMTDDEMAESLKPHNKPKERIVYVERPPGGGYVQPPLPNATTVLVLGIVSIVIWIAGIPCGIIAINLSKKDKALWAANPDQYSQPSFNQLNAGRICGIIGLCLSSFMFLFMIFYFIFFFAIIGSTMAHGMH